MCICRQSAVRIIGIDAEKGREVLMKSYGLSRSGRWNVILLMVGALLVWLFAIWTFRYLLFLQVDPPQLSLALTAVWSEGLTVNRTVPLLFMVVLIVAAPLTLWNMALEWAATYTPTPDGLRYRALGIELTIAWSTVAEVRLVDADSDEPSHELRLKIDPTGQIGNPLLRLLFVQAYGKSALPVHHGVEQSDDLIDEIRRRSGIVAV